MSRIRSFVSGLALIDAMLVFVAVASIPAFATYVRHADGADGMETSRQAALVAPAQAAPVAAQLAAAPALHTASAELAALPL